MEIHEFHMKIAQFRLNTVFHFLPKLGVITLTVECLTVTLWYKQQVTFLAPKFD